MRNDFVDMCVSQQGTEYLQLNFWDGGPLFFSEHCSAHRIWRKCIPPLVVVIASVLFPQSFLSAQAPPRKNVLIISELGESNRGIAMLTNELFEGLLGSRDYQIEVYFESLDLSISESLASRRERGEEIIVEYRNKTPDVIVAVGSVPIQFLTTAEQTPFADVPVVISAGFLGAAPPPKLGPRFTGTWMHTDAAATIDAALRLYPNTRHIAIVSGSSKFDRDRLADIQVELQGYKSKFDLMDLTDLPMNQLLGKLRQLPEGTIILYVSFFRDGVGKLFINATTALPMVSEAANAPVFGMADSYLGHGIVGGRVVNFGAQGRIATQIVLEILAGKKPEGIPVSIAANYYMFDWKQLRRRHLKESALPPGSVVLFRELSFWESTWWIWLTVLSIIVALSVLAAILQRSRTQLRTAKDSQRQLSGMLISAQETERRRLASELHDDFSQRLALLALRLENVAEAIPVSPEEANRQLYELVNSISEIGADLHALSHQLHSSTLESLGLVPAVAGLCKEFTSQQHVKVDFTSDGIPGSVNPEEALGVFRIVQEGLRNLKKHSGAQEAWVSLRGNGELLEVTVRDQGCGFDLAKLGENPGLGIRSMEERARLLNGEFKVHSHPGEGTTIQASVPFTSNEGS